MKKLNTLTVSGLMIGPILGSGIVFLPPFAYDILGEHAIIAWVIIMALGALFAYVFARMTVITADNQGISAIVGSVLGDRFRVLAANYLTTAVFFGPAAVALTAADFIRSALPSAEAVDPAVIAAAILLFCAFLVLSGGSAMGKFVLVLSSITACLLLVGSMATLLSAPTIAVPHTLPPAGRLGHTLLLIFWAIVGWEVMGNYVEEVENPARTMMRAMKISLSAIILIYLLTAFALQNLKNTVMSAVLSPILGGLSAGVFGILAAGLCICTIATFTGAVARQTTARIRKTELPAPFHRRVTAIAALLTVNLLVLFLYAENILSFSNLVEAANTMFIGNALLGLFSGFRLLRHIGVRIGIVLLLIMLLLLLLFSPGYAIGLLVLVTLLSLLFRTRKHRAAANKIPD